MSTLMKNNKTIAGLVGSGVELIADKQVHTSITVDLSKYSELLFLMWLGNSDTCVSAVCPVLIGKTIRPNFGDTYISIDITSTGLTISESAGAYTGSTVSIYGIKL
jgi:hypothetical protein